MFANRDRLDEFIADPNTVTNLRCLVAAGGDGTVGSLLQRHPSVPIATLPLGTENLLARHLGVTRNAQLVADTIEQGMTRQFDVGDVNGHAFLLMASAGVDADVVQRLDKTRSGNIRHLSYVKPILQSFVKYSYPRLRVTRPDGTLLAEGTHVVVANMAEYGFRMPFCPTANPHDGLMHVRVFKRSGPVATIFHAIRTRLGFADRDTEICRFDEPAIAISSDQPGTPTQMDGDPAPDCPLEITVRPSSMTLIVINQHE